ncbi:hypothetical protein PENSUB_624 [Penicillium subrubescens]|uniref:Transcriptional activator of proteases prtT n=1 Tax=Penicillium subrubescens TaxID=1316194 RepID=A0A1Q5ULW5_9EURO|nr:hypothetical protein PENSUB_624 [Penicillium subrubescens]
MPPDRGRASRACASCRKQKTRCYEPGTPGRACLRCERLQQKCSLAPQADSPEEERQQQQQQQQQQPVPSLGTDARLERLERTVATLLDRLGDGPSSADHELSRPGSVLTTPDPGDQIYQETESAAAPIMVIRDLANDTRVEPSPETKSLGAVLDDLISPDLALTLLSISDFMYVVDYRGAGPLEHRQLATQWIRIAALTV